MPHDATQNVDPPEALSFAASAPANPQRELAQPIDRIEILHIAALAQADPRSVLRELRGERVKGMAGDRIRRVLARRGVHPDPSSVTRNTSANQPSNAVPTAGSDE